MTRQLGTMPIKTFESIIDQIKPWTGGEWDEWTDFVRKNYGIKENEIGENHFFLYIVPKVITLHGYGEPLLDNHIMYRLQYLNDHNIPSYFSCHPNNLDLHLGQDLFENGLNYLKCSTDNIRYFEEKKDMLKQLIAIKHQNGYGTKLIFDIVGSQNSFPKLSKLFNINDVYMYQKSTDNQWYRQSNGNQKSVHWNEICQFPWSSMSVMWDGSVVPCSQDFNCEMVLGDVNDGKLYDIWNGIRYYNFRNSHLKLDFDLKCVDRCDMRVIGNKKEKSGKELITIVETPGVR